MINQAKEGITILHPLPRVDEISTDVDDYKGAAYFRQAHNGLYIRMALLALVTGRV
jgi:aspartate carbamoyltransferase catalytic subunit